MQTSRGLTRDLRTTIQRADSSRARQASWRSLGLTADRSRGLFGSVRVRYFGGRPLLEDNSVRSKAPGSLNGQLGYHVTPRAHVVLDAFNLLNAEVSDIDYFYRSRLPGEPAGGVDDIHTHPTLPRSIRLVLRVQY